MTTSHSIFYKYDEPYPGWYQIWSKWTNGKLWLKASNYDLPHLLPKNSAGNLSDRTEKTP